MRHRCIGGCGQRRPGRGQLCDGCTARLPEDLQLQLADSEEQPTAVSDARRWLRRNRPVKTS